MKKIFKIEIDCPNCAMKIEEVANAFPGIVKATVNFMTLKMNVEFEPDVDYKEVMTSLLVKCKKIDSDCEIYF